jgi:ABC-type antimicrobial peptide transport system permease subunit
MDDIRREVAAAPGRREVALVFDPPLGETASRAQVRFLQRSPEFVVSKYVTDGFFNVVRTAILAGRDFRRSDFTGPPVVVVNEHFATTYFGGIDQAVGQEFDYGPRHRIIGVVANVRELGVTDPMVPVVYPLLVTSMRTPGMFHVVSRESRANVNANAVRLVEDAVRRADPTMHVEASALADRLREQTTTARSQATVLAVLALVTLGLAVLGIHATIAQMVEDRRREMAIRAALGASPKTLVVMTVRGVSVAVATGVIGGGLLSWIVARVTRQFLFDMSPFDPVVWVGAATLLLVTAGLAAWLPARRVGQANPVLALKDA